MRIQVFYYIQASHKNRKNFIGAIKQGNQMVVTHGKDWEDLEDHYKDRFGRPAIRSSSLNLDYIGMNNVDLQDLERIFTFLDINSPSSIKMKPGRTRIPQDSRLNTKGKTRVLEQENYYYKITTDQSPHAGGGCADILTLKGVSGYLKNRRRYVYYVQVTSSFIKPNHIQNTLGCVCLLHLLNTNLAARV